MASITTGAPQEFLSRNTIERAHRNSTGLASDAEWSPSVYLFLLRYPWPLCAAICRAWPAWSENCQLDDEVVDRLQNGRRPCHPNRV